MAAGGIGLGVILAYLVQWGAAPWLLDRVGIYMGLEWLAPWQWGVLGIIWVAGLMAAAIPATLAYKRTLADGMQVRS